MTMEIEQDFWEGTELERDFETRDNIGRLGEMSFKGTIVDMRH